MKTIVAMAAAFALLAGVSAPADASSHKKKRLYASPYGKPYSRAYGYRHQDDSIGGYYEHRLEAVRFGSQRWWKIYDEQNGGSRRR